MPSSRSRRIQDTSTIPFKTAIPHSAIKPTEAGTDKYSPVIAKPNTPPIEANGKTKIISEASLSELNIMNNKKKMAAIVNGMMIISVPIARSMFSNCPPHEK